MDRNIKLVVSYDGYDYHGWQKQPNIRTIQGEIEDALYKILGHKVDLVGSGRTDSGVHAIGQVANFKTSARIGSDKVKFAINSILPQQIRIKESYEVGETFHSRFDAKGKTYIYNIYNDKINNPFFNKYTYFIPYDIDIKLINDASRSLLGTHDFKAFKAANTSVINTVRTINEVKIYNKKNIISIEITGNGFLYNMVRIIVGTLIEIGSNRKSKKCIGEAIKTGNRNLLGHTAKPYGLFLKKVHY